MFIIMITKFRFKYGQLQVSMATILAIIQAYNQSIVTKQSLLTTKIT